MSQLIINVPVVAQLFLKGKENVFMLHVNQTKLRITLFLIIQLLQVGVGVFGKEFEL